MTAAVVASEHHQAAKDYWQELAEADVPVCFSELLRLEYAHILRILPSRLDHATQRSFGLHRWERQVVREHWYQFGWKLFDDFMAQASLVQEIALNAAILNMSNNLMATCNIGSYDAAHVATALAIGATELASVDGHFSRVNHLVAVRLIRDQPATST